MNIFLVIPSYNEGSALTKTIDKAKKYISANKIVVVDDGSNKIKKYKNKKGIWFLRHKINLGKGAAMRTGIEFAFKQGADAVIFMDADLQHDSKEIKKFKKFLLEGYDIVFGSRREGMDIPLVRYAGKKFGSVFINLVFGIYISDILSGYRAMTKNAYTKVKWESDRYSVETEMVVRLSKHKNSLKWVEFPIETIYVDKYKGMTIIDGFKMLLSSIKWKLG